MADLPLVLQIDLVADEGLHDVGVRMLVDAVQPILHVGEGLAARHVEGHDHAIRLLIERVSDRAEALLTRRVPNLHRDVISLGRLVARRHVVKPDGGHVRLRESLILVPEQTNLVGNYSLTFSGERSYPRHHRQE